MAGVLQPTMDSLITSRRQFLNDSENYIHWDPPTVPGLGPDKVSWLYEVSLFQE